MHADIYYVVYIYMNEANGNKYSSTINRGYAAGFTTYLCHIWTRTISHRNILTYTSLSL